MSGTLGMGLYIKECPRMIEKQWVVHTPSMFLSPWQAVLLRSHWLNTTQPKLAIAC